MIVKGISKDKHLRANFDIGIVNENTVEVEIPNGEKFLLLRQDILQALGLKEYEKLTIELKEYMSLYNDAAKLLNSANHEISQIKGIVQEHKA